MPESDPINLTKGSLALGKLVIRARKDPKIQNRVARWMKKSGLARKSPDSITQEEFAFWVSAMTGISVSESAIGRLERGEGQTGPAIIPLLALCHELKLLKLPNGSPCNMNRVADILCGKIEFDEEWLWGEQEDN